MEPVDEGFVVIDVLGRRRTGVVEWSTAEDTLDELGLSYLPEPTNCSRTTGRGFGSASQRCPPSQSESRKRIGAI